VGNEKSDPVSGLIQCISDLFFYLHGHNEIIIIHLIIFEFSSIEA